MNTVIQQPIIDQLEQRLQKLERLRHERKTWLNDLISPVEVRFETLSKLRHEKNALDAANIIRFPIEKRLSENETL